MSQISLVIIHSVVSSICTSTFTFRERQEQGYYLRGLGLAGHPPVHPGENKLLTFPIKNIKYQNELPRFQRREAQAFTLKASHLVPIGSPWLVCWTLGDQPSLSSLRQP